MTGSESLDLWALFFSAFISSTLLPGGSELVLAKLAHTGTSQTAAIVSVATLGNALGGWVTFAMGWWAARLLPLEEKLSGERQRALGRVRRFGPPVLLLSWLPVVGDPLCFAAGWAKTGMVLSLLYIFVGKLLRYLVIVWLV